MAVLKLNPTAAPDFSSSSAILARAGLALDRGFESAQGLLGSYQAGQTERADNEVFAEVAKLKTQEQIDAYFDGDGIGGRPISVAARDRLGKMRSNLANLNQVQQSTAASLSATARLEAIETDRAAKERDRIQFQKIARENGPLAAQAWIEAQQFGKTGSAGVAPIPGGSGAAGPLAAATNANPPTPTTPGGVPTIGGGSRAPAHLVGNESGGNFQATNEAVGSGGIKGHDGRVQFGAKRLDDIKAAGVIPKDMTREQFRNSPEAQIAAENWHFDDIDANIAKNGYSKYIGTTINGVEVTQQGMADVQHLGGATGLKKFLESNGEYDVADDNGTKLSDYLRAGGEATAGASIETQALGAPSSVAVDPIAAAVEGPGPGGYSIKVPGSENVSNLFASNLPSLTDPSKTSAGILPTGPTGAAPGPEDSVAPPSTAAAVANADLGVPTISMEELKREFAQKGMAATPAAVAIEASVRPPEVAEIVTNPRVARDARIAQIMANPTLTGDQMISKLAALDQATSEGEAENLRVKAIARKERLTQIAINWANDPQSDMKLETLQKLLSDQPGTAMEKLNAGLYALEIGNGALENIISPSYIKDPSVERGINEELERNRRSLKIQDIHRILNNAKLFGEDDPVKGLISFVQSGTDGKAQTPYFWGGLGEDATDENGLRQLIISIANAAEVSPAEAAAAMADKFERDPRGFNTNENRFNKEESITYLRNTLTENARRTYEGSVERVARREDELNSGSIRLSVMRRQYAKMNAGNSTVQERKDAKQAITALQTTLRSGRTPLDGEQALSDYVGKNGMGISEYLSTLTPGSAAQERATNFIRLTIKGDLNLSPADKRLLLASISS